MVSQEVRNALKLLHEQITPNAPESACDCWAEFIGAVIEIARQDGQRQVLKLGTSHSCPMLSKDEIIIRAFQSSGFDLEDFGLKEPE